jgi:mono/diheme cytochrome c family protein
MRARKFTTIVIVICLVLALGAGVFTIAAWQPALAPIAPPIPARLDASLVSRGAELAAIGDCAVCHTAPSGAGFAGGVGIPTPFGTIYSTNITPDAETGIGTWSEAAFQRAMRNGIRRDGAYLYPAFPYDHFTLVSDDDDKALYAFLMTRRPVRAVAQANKLPFPLNVRLAMFAWDLLFLRTGPYQADPAQDESWNRGAYLADGLGHCGACHTPRDALGAEKQDEKFAGGTAEGWTAYALNASSPAPVPWDAAALSRYLKHGFDAQHGDPRGPMVEVVDDLRSASPDDVQAIATYIAAQMAGAAPESDQIAQQVAVQSQRNASVVAASADSQADAMRAVDTKNNEGAVIYAGACSGCHEGPRALPYGGIDLALSTGVSGPSANNLVRVVLYGLPAAEGSRGPIMPGFASAIDDSQLAALARYLRARFTTKGPWRDVEKSVHDARTSGRVGATRSMAQPSEHNEAQR